MDVKVFTLKDMALYNLQYLCKCVPLFAAVIGVFIAPVTATNAEESASGEYTQEQINEMINNPLGELWLLFGQSDFVVYDGDALDLVGEDEKLMNFTLLQPVLPM